MWFHDDMSMTSGRSRFVLLPLVLASALLLGGCALVSVETGDATAASTPTPTAACPQVEGVVLPPKCAPYDPDNAMAQNDRYKERMEFSDEAAAAVAQSMSDMRVRLETLRTDGAISIDAVQGALRAVGLPDVVVRGDAHAVEFDVDAPEGGCVFGEVRPDSVRVEAGGYILDGGCLPAQ